MLDSKIVALLLIGIALFLIYKYSLKCKKKKESKNLENEYFFQYNEPLQINLNNDSYDKHADLKPILKTNKTKHNKRVRFNLPGMSKKINIYDQDNTTELCQKKRS